MRRWETILVAIIIATTGIWLELRGGTKVQQFNLLFSVILGVTMGLILCFLVVAYALSELEICFTKVKESTAKIVVVGDKYVRTIIALKGHYVEETPGDGGIIKKLRAGETEPGGWLVRHFGIYWVGIYPWRKIYTYELGWVTWKLNGEDQYGPKREHETLNHILLADYPYYLEIRGAECLDRIPVDLKIVVTATSRNPYKTVFRNHDWLRQMNAVASSAVRNFIAAITYDEVLNNKSAHTNWCAESVEKVLQSNLKKFYGISIRTVEIMEINPGENISEETMKVYRAKQEAERIRIEAKGTADATVTKAEATAKGTVLQATADAFKITTEATAKAAGLKTRAQALTEAGDAGEIIIRTDTLPTLEKGDKWIVGSDILGSIRKIIGGGK